MTRTPIRRAWRHAFAALLVTPLVLAALPAQKRPLTHEDYDSWKSIRSTSYSQDGKWVAYTVEPQWGDGVLVVRQVDGEVEHRHDRGTSPSFSQDGRYVVFRITESKVEERRKKIEELRKKGKLEEKEGEGPSAEEQRAAMMQRFGRGRGRGGRGGGASGPGDMGILDLGTGKVEVIERVKGFRLPTESDYLVYHKDKPKEEDEKDKEEDKEGEKKEGEGQESPETAGGQRAGGRRSGRGGRRGGRGQRPEAGEQGQEGEAKQEPEKKDEDPAEKKRKDGTDLVVRKLVDGAETTFPSVLGYGVLGKGEWLYFHTQTKKVVPEVKMGLFAYKPADGTKVALLEGAGNHGGFSLDKAEEIVAFTSDVEHFADEKPVSAIYLWRFDGKPANKVIAADTPGIPEGKVPAGGMAFSTDASVMTFGVRNAPEEDPPEILPDEKVVLDLWHWQDGMLQTMQARSAGRERNPTVPCAYHLEDGAIVVLGDDRIDSVRLITPDGALALATDGTPYEKLVSWDGRHSDVYLVNTVDGSRRKVLERIRGSASASPLGRYLTWFADDHYHCMDTSTLQTRNLTADLGVPFANELEDRPQPASGYGIAGWTTEDAELLINDRYDVWKVDPDTGRANCITDGMGRARKITFRYVSIDLEGESSEQEEGFDPFAPDAATDPVPETILVSATDNETMATGYFMESTTDVQKPRKLVMLDKRFSGLTKAEKAERFFFTLQTYAEFPDLWTSDMQFGGMAKLSNANPQQDQIRWGKAELVRWTSANGTPLKGVLVKPDGFDPKKKYPMMVYFYERLSQNLHRYVSPSPGTSPNAAYYVSNGYLWFTPDIEYRVGYPGPSCLACVVPGVQSLIAEGYVDPERIGAAGHSWGGYQTAFLVTRTDIFAAVESGAPVSNMFSAYGGIRWSSGMVRQFQYEKTQSRIGGTIWEYPMRYWENSPIFFADKVNTPVLMLHNDEDGAVPWYQGIEYFTALRRLGKEAYMFNYVGEAHGLRKRQNQKDWTRRMQEYFDHHLKGAPAPKWMREGVPYIERDEEKLPYAPSFLEITAPEPEPAEASTSTSANGSTSGGN